MAKAPKRKNLKPPGKCIFCGNTVSRRGEHLWPQWMHEFLDGGKYKGKTQFEGFLSEPGLTPGKHDMRQGASHTRTIKCVCTPCNSGWMSRLETDAKRFLVPVVKGERCLLEQVELDVLAKWLCLKTLVAENDNRDGAVTPQSNRYAFKESGAFPVSLRIWIGYMSKTQPWKMKAAYCPVWIMPEGQSPDDNRPNLYALMITFGSLVAFAMNTTLPIDLHKMWGRPIQGFELLFPRLNKKPRQQAWPMPFALTGSYIDDLLNSFFRFGNAVSKLPITVSNR